VARNRLVAAVVAVVVAVAGATVWVWASRDRSVGIGESGCGSGWHGPIAGHQVWTLRNTSDNAAQVYLIDPGRDLVFAETRDLTPGAARDMGTTLGSGRYALRCVFSDGTVRTSAAYAVRGRVPGAVAGVRPLPDLDLQPATAAYRTYVDDRLPALRDAIGRLAHDIDTGRLDRARIDWLPAHLDYERLGAAYNSFGDFDSSMNGTTEGLPGGVRDDGWTGFFRLEYGLWHDQPAAELAPIADRLRGDVAALIADFPSEDVDPFDLPLRAHEILENALQFQVGGADDYGSGTTLATTYANTDGTLGVLATLEPLIRQRRPSLLPALDAGIATVRADLDADRDAGAWIPAADLTPARRARLDADLGSLLEQLAVVPDLLAERTSA
jgi:iron uptake system EfeUOB component EfeO/EfeM